MLTRYRWPLFFAGWIILCITEFLKVYYIMPMPGSQADDVVELAYFINGMVWITRAIGILLMAAVIVPVFKNAKVVGKVAAISFLLLGITIVYLTNFVMLAEKMFLQPETKIFATIEENKISEDALVIGVEQGNKSKAYPVTLIGYHHQVRDTIGDVAVMITYCTVCRTGRAYSPIVDGKNEEFRLVGMDHFNAMFEDKTTKSWWRQATGECVAGKRKGERLIEITSQQMTLKAWMELHPQSLIMQPDKKFENEYLGLTGFDKGEIKSVLVGSSKTSWEKKSWVVGIEVEGISAAYDWNTLKEKKLIQDTVGNLSIAVVMGDDGQSFFTWNRNLNGEILNFVYDSVNILTDEKSHSKWSASGVCISGELAGTKMKPVQSYQEFWHSWQTFHPNTRQSN
ncbi:MAG: hypothetical protein POELPBGB_03498 [Bacteroidia bacterium]|nr:hypothetical protein [Bacteroidia bacterium]